MSSFRRMLMAKVLSADTTQYIEGWCNVYNSTYSFRLGLSPNSYTTIQVNTDENGYWKWKKPEDTNVYLLVCAFCYFAEEKIKCTRIRFSENFDFSKVTNTQAAFSGTSSQQNTTIQYVENFAIGENVTTINYPFYGASALKSIDVEIKSTASLGSFLHNTTSLEHFGIKGDLPTPSGISSFLRNSSTIEADIPNISNGIATQYAYGNMTHLTTINRCGTIAETLSFSVSPLSLASAKLIISNLQDLGSGSETITFSSTTWNYIDAEASGEALDMIAQKRLIGWTFA